MRISDWSSDVCSSDLAVKFYLVTNKHVLPQANAASEITFKISAPWQTGTDKFIDVPIPIYDNATLYSYIKINANGEDVAVIEFTSFFIRNKQIGRAHV